MNDNSNVAELLYGLRHYRNLFPENAAERIKLSLLADYLVLLGRVDACNKNAYNHPSKLQLIASNFDRVHHLSLSLRSYYTDDPVEKYAQHGNRVQIPDCHHTSKHEMIFPDFHLPKPTKACLSNPKNR